MTSSAISSAAEMPFKVLIVVDGKPNFRVIIDRDGHYIKSLTLLEIKSEIGNHHRELAALGVCDDLQFSFELFDEDFSEYVHIENDTEIKNLAKLRAIRVSDLDICSLPVSPTASDRSNSSSQQIRTKIINGPLSETTNLDEIHDFIEENQKRELLREEKIINRKVVERDWQEKAVIFVRELIKHIWAILKTTNWAAVFMAFALIAIVSIVGGWTVMALAGVAPVKIELAADFWNLSFKANIAV